MSNKLVSNLIKAFSWILLGFSALLMIYIFMDPLLSASDLPKDEIAPRSEIGLYWAYFLTAIAVVLSVLFPIIEFIKNPKEGLKVVGVIVLMAVIFLVAYFLADPTPLTGTANNENFSNESVLVLTDTGLYATYTLVAISLLTVLFSSCKGMFSK